MNDTYHTTIERDGIDFDVEVFYQYTPKVPARVQCRMEDCDPGTPAEVTIVDYISAIELTVDELETLETEILAKEKYNR